MKKIAYGLFIIVCCGIISSCNIHNHMPLVKVAGRLEGDWVSQTYLDTLEQTKSPQRAYRASALRIVRIERDSFSRTEQAILTFQEGDNWLLERDSSGLLFSSVFDEQLTLRVKMLSNHKLQLGNKTFVRVLDFLGASNKNIMLVRKLLFAGTYDWDGKIVEFGEDGRIEGMEAVGIKIYHPVVYYYNNRSQIDQLWLNKKGIDQRYGFHFKGNKLYIYQLMNPNRAVYGAHDWKLGELLFELKKQGKTNWIF